MFGLLVSERPASMGGLMPIPVTAIIRVCEHFGYTTAETDDMIRVIRAVDAAQLAAINKKADKPSK